MDWILQDKTNSDVSWKSTHDNIIKVLNEFLPNPKLGVEIGVAYGSNSYNLLNNFRNLKLFSIDPYVEYSQVDSMSHNTTGIKGDQLFEYTSNRLSTAFNDRSIFYRETSDTAKNKFEEHSLDFVFIDGDHSYEGVKKDIYNMLDKIRPGGIIAGDDYGLANDIFGVERAVNEFSSSQSKKVNLKDLVWWIIL